MFVYIKTISKNKIPNKLSTLPIPWKLGNPFPPPFMPKLSNKQKNNTNNPANLYELLLSKKMIENNKLNKLVKIAIFKKCKPTKFPFIWKFGKI